MERTFASAALAATLVAVISVGAAAAAPGDTLYAKPGRLAPAGDGARLNLYCLGHGTPTVIFDSGWEDWAPAWAIVQPRVAMFTRACAYDRAGVGFSAPGPLLRTSVRIAGELRAALRNAGVRGPYILVGHAFGSDNMRTFAARYMEDVAGSVLVEGDVMDFEPADLRDADHRGEVDNVAQLRACRDLVASGKPLSAQGQPPRTCAQQFFRGIPEVAWSSELNAALLKVAQTKVAMYDAYASEMEQMAADEAWLQQHRRSYGDRPIRAIVTGHHGVGSLSAQAAPPTPSQVRYRDEAAKGQAAWLALSSNGKQVVAANSSEYVVFDAPDVVVGAIREVFDQSRAATHR